jgi:hypothetical protein
MRRRERLAVRAGFRWIIRGFTAGGLGLLLGGCEGSLTANLATDPPADTSITNVQVNLRGLDFRMSDGTSKTLEFNSGELVDLMDSQVRDSTRLFTNEELPLGRYTGVRLLFDEDVSDNVVTDRDGDTPLVLADGAYAAVDFSVEDQKSSTETLSLMLDLRQSLSYQESGNRYTLTPALRSVATDDAARIEGVVTVACPLDPLLVPGEAVYLFAGTDVSPDDLDGTGVEPFATTSVTRSVTTALVYSLRFLPAGEYTLALTCNGYEDELGVDDNLRFRNVTNVRINRRDVVLRNFN